MSDASQPLIALALDSADLDPPAVGGRLDPAPWLELVLAAEHAGTALVTLADTHRGGDGIPRPDAVMLSAYLGARTERIGIIAAADTTVSEPYLLATQIATADFVSHGRAGWWVQVSGTPEDGAYVGPREAAVGPAAWSEAAEFVEVVRALWDSWEDGAEIRDIAHQRFIDRDRIHHIDFSGTYLSVKGPSITPRSPQAQPPLALKLASAEDTTALELAAAQADLVFLPDGVDPAAIRSAATEQGRQLMLLRDMAIDTVDAADLAALRAAGFDGARLTGTARSGQLSGLGEVLGPVASAATGPVTLRDQLGLTRPPNRYAQVLSPDGVGG